MKPLSMIILLSFNLHGDRCDDRHKGSTWSHISDCWSDALSKDDLRAPEASTNMSNPCLMFQFLTSFRSRHEIHDLVPYRRNGATYCHVCLRRVYLRTPGRSRTTSGWLAGIHPMETWLKCLTHYVPAAISRTFVSTKTRCSTIWLWRMYQKPCFCGLLIGECWVIIWTAFWSLVHSKLSVTMFPKQHSL